MGKLTISIAIFNSYVKLPEGIIKCLSSGSEGAKLLGVSIFAIHSLFTAEARNYLEFLNHLIAVEELEESKFE